jgi:hypothetical protein
MLERCGCDRQGGPALCSIGAVWCGPMFHRCGGRNGRGRAGGLGGGAGVAGGAVGLEGLGPGRAGPGNDRGDDAGTDGRRSGITDPVRSAPRDHQRETGAATIMTPSAGVRECEIPADAATSPAVWGL